MIAALFFLFLIAAQYAVTYQALRLKRYDWLLYLQLYALYSYDFVFINASYYLPTVLIGALKLYNEYLVTYLIFHFLFVLKRRITMKDRADRYIWVLVLLPSASVLLINDMLRYEVPVKTLVGLRMYLLPILLPYLLHRCGMIKVYRPAIISGIIIIISIIAGLYGWAQKLSFNGDISTLWFYDYFTVDDYNPMNYKVADYVRNDTLRVTGIFVSPLIYSISLIVPLLLLTSILMNDGKLLSLKHRIGIIILIVFFLASQWIAVTRTPFIIDAIGVATLMACKFKPRLLTYQRLLLIPLSIIAATFITLISGATQEASALGRVAQYQSFFKYFSPWGLGFNHAYVLSYFDSYFLSSALLFGVLFIMLLCFLYKLGSAAFQAYRYRADYYNMVLVAMTISFVYTFAFQFVAGSAAYKLYFLLLFIVLAYTESIDHSKFSPVHRRSL